MRVRQLGPLVLGLSVVALAVTVAEICAFGDRSAEPDGGLADPARCLPSSVANEPDHEDAAARLLERWAPTFVQHVARADAGRDRPTRVDFDGDWNAKNKWRSQARFGTSLPPAAYGAAVLTRTHAYLTYTLYYPRDWIRPICLPYICHDNDLESVLVVVRRDRDWERGEERDGELVLIESKAHLRYHELSAREVAVDEDGRPLVAVEAKGHGPHPCRRGDDACAPGPRRLVYVRGDPPSPPPRRADGREVRYELLSLRESLWARRHPIESQGLWTAGETGPLYYAGTRCGRMGDRMGAAMAWSRFPGGVRPPWGLKGSSGARGDWFLDPAAVVAERHPTVAAAGDGALEYVFHPYLNDLARECLGGDCAHPEPPPEPSRASRWAGMGAIAAAFVLALQRSLSRLSRLAGAQPSSRRKRER